MELKLFFYYFILKKKSISSIKIKPSSSSDTSLNIPMIETNNENVEHLSMNYDYKKDIIKIKKKNSCNFTIINCYL